MPPARSTPITLHEIHTRKPIDIMDDPVVQFADVSAYFNKMFTNTTFVLFIEFLVIFMCLALIF